MCIYCRRAKEWQAREPLGDKEELEYFPMPPKKVVAPLYLVSEYECMLIEHAKFYRRWSWFWMVFAVLGWAAYISCLLGVL